MSKNTAEIRVGRLLEITVGGFDNMQDIHDHYERLVAAFAKVPASSKVVIAADWRKCKNIAPNAQHGVGSILRDFNSQIDRSSMLASPTSPQAVLQYLELIRKGGHTSRRLYLSRDEAL